MTTHTIGTAVLDRLHRLGVRHMFGIPGDYVLGLYKLMESSPIQHVATTREDCAGFAADAYARINGIGALCVTYCVGGLNTVNAIACGVIDTRMNGCFDEAERLALRDEIPADRFGSPEEVAAAAVKLSQMPDYLTGQIITFDGGWI